MSRMLGLVIVIAVSAGCGGDGDRDNGITEPSAPEPLTAARIVPTEGWPLYSVQIVGTGFKPGVRVTYDGVDARIGRVTATSIEHSPAMHVPGPVDVVVTNPDGNSLKLTAGFVFKAAQIELTKAEVDAGEALSVSWAGPHDPSDFAPPDFIGLYRADDPHNAKLWEVRTEVGGTGVVELKAPSEPGKYEFRYYMVSQHLLATTPLTVR